MLETNQLVLAYLPIHARFFQYIELIKIFVVPRHAIWTIFSEYQQRLSLNNREPSESRKIPPEISRFEFGSH